MRGRRAARRLKGAIGRSALGGPCRRVVRALRGGAIDWGDLRRLRPFCADFGLSRGTAVDRFYIETFLEGHRARIRGEVLEVQEPLYTRQFGTDVSHEHVVDIDAGNPMATMVIDLCQPGALPTEAFDAIILTQVLQCLADPEAALRNLFGSLRAGGSMLITAPTLSKLAYDLVPETDFWRWTPDGLRRQLASTLPEADIEVAGRGNVFVSVAYLMGLSLEELRPDELLFEDPIHPFIVTAWVRK